MKEIMKKFLELFQESVIMQAMLIVLIFGPISYCVIIQAPIPDRIADWGSIVIGFFFGAKMAYQIMKGR